MKGWNEDSILVCLVFLSVGQLSSVQDVFCGKSVRYYTKIFIQVILGEILFVLCSSETELVQDIAVPFCFVAVGLNLLILTAF